MTKPVDYSKWDNLDISDDEKDFHPNIDASLMIRIKREQRAKREAEEAVKIQSLKAQGTEEALKQAADIERKKKLHVGNICRVVQEKTIIGGSTKETPSLPKTPADMNNMKPSEDDEMADYLDRFESSLTEYSELNELAETEQYLYDHPEVLHEHGCNFLLLSQLELEMDGHRNEMLNCVRQYIILRNILDLGKEARRTEEFRPMVKLFFKTVNNDGKKQEDLNRETLAFAQNIINRAIQKRMEQQLEEEVD
jgi:cell division cycle protein 37